MPIIIGTVSMPESAGLLPITSWKNSGKNTLEPIRPMKVSAITMLATLNTRIWNRSGGSTGSAARRRWNTSQPPSTTASTEHT
jgi:hypothetical protein